MLSADETTTLTPTLTPALRRGLRLFAQTDDQPRARRATDVILLGLSCLCLLTVALLADPDPGISNALSDFFAALPHTLEGAWQAMADLPMVWAVVVLVGALIRHRRSIARDMVLSVVVGVAAWLLLARTVGGGWPECCEVLARTSPPPVFPAARLAVPGSAIITASPHLVRPARRLGHWVLLLGSIATIALASSTLIGVLAGILCAAAAASAVHLAVGSSAGRPSLDDVRFGLGQMGVVTTELGIAARQPAGQFAVAATGEDGDELLVKVYGRDAYDAALLSTVQRTIWLRRAGSPVGFGRLRQVEHEAFLTLLAGQAGVPTDQVVIAGLTPSDDALLVLRRTGTLVAPAKREITSETARVERFSGADALARMRELWELVEQLHSNAIAHGQIDEAHLIVDHDGRLGLVDFRGASVAPTDAQLRSDEVQAFVATLIVAGRDLAIAALVSNRSNERIAALLPYLQPVALTGDQRRMINALDIDLDDVRSDVAAAINLEAPRLVQLRRFSIGSVIRIALPLLAVFVLISALAGFDLDEFVESLQDAIWWLVLLGLIVAQLPRIAQAVSTLGAAPIPLPLGPVYALQLAISYVNLAIPTAAARIAVNIRFFQRQGVPPGAAVATGALDGVSGFIVQAILLVSFLLFGEMSLDIDFSDPSSDALRLVVIILVGVAVAAAVIAVIPRLRNFAVGWILRLAHEAFGVLRGLHSPRRLAMLFGGNLVAELLFASTLGIFVLAFGYPIPLQELLFINICVSLLAGLIPVPGGIGVTEGGLIFGLTAAGMPQEAAFAAVTFYRLATFYLPPIWGFFSLRWLERNRYL